MVSNEAPIPQVGTKARLPEVEEEDVPVLVRREVGGGVDEGVIKDQDPARLPVGALITDGE